LELVDPRGGLVHQGLIAVACGGFLVGPAVAVAGAHGGLLMRSRGGPVGQSCLDVLGGGSSMGDLGAPQGVFGSLASQLK
jgi:hypothetical protein